MRGFEGDRKLVCSAVLGSAITLLTVFVMQAPWLKQVLGQSENGGVSSARKMLTASAVRGATAARRLIPFQAYVTDADGRPVSGPHTLTFRLFSVPDGGVSVSTWFEPHLDTPVSNGLANVTVGSRVAFPSDISFDQRLYLEVQVDNGTPLSPRHAIVPAIFAADADRAKHALAAEFATEAGHAADSTEADSAKNCDQATHAERSRFADRAAELDQPIPPIGSIIAWHKNPNPGNPGAALALPEGEGWLECNGQPLPMDSPLRETGASNTPDLNTAGGYAGGRFLRGGATSGTARMPQMCGTFTTPIFMEVPIWFETRIAM